MKYRIGIDVGGTNTDGVLLDETNQIIAKTKQSTTPDVMTGIEQAIQILLSESKVDKSQITQAMLGTTHCTNAIVERKNLNPVVHFRLAAPATLAIQPLAAMPDDLIRVLSHQVFIVAGGFDYDGTELSPINPQEIRQKLHEVQGKIKAVSVCGVFSPVSNAQELAVAQILRDELGEEIALSLSYEIGSVGLLERENASILNAALFQTIQQTAKGFIDALNQNGVNAKVYFGQNDGTLMLMRHALAYPILTIASGPTNSIRGASYLAQIQEALVIDVGGTTTDVGVLSQGFPRESNLAVEIGGARTNFRMPDIASVGIGGGTIVHINENQGFKIGPDSVGYRITSEALVFGGSTITLTDIAVARGMAQIGDATKVAHLAPEFVEAVFRDYVQHIERVIEKMKTSNTLIPIILVGGGAILLPDHLRGASRIIKPANFDVANAIGVAIAQASGEVDMVVALDDKPLKTGMEEAIAQATRRAIEAGADPDTIKIVDMESTPLAYMPGNATRIRVKAAGTLDYSKN